VHFHTQYALCTCIRYSKENLKIHTWGTLPSLPPSPDPSRPSPSSPSENRRRKKKELECGSMPNVMAALPNIGGALCKSSLSPFLVPHRKLWLTPAAQVPCSNGANIGEHKTSMQSEFCSWQNSVRGQETPKMYIKCNSAGDGQTSCKVWSTSVERRQCSNEASTRNPLKFAEVPQTTQNNSTVSRPKLTIF